MTVLPLPVTVPTVPLPPAMPSTAQAKPVLVLPETVAVKVAEAPVASVRVVGLRATATGVGARMVRPAEADLVGSAALVAVRVWLPAVVGAR